LLNVTGTNADGGILTLENNSNSLQTNRAVGQLDFYSNDGSANGTGVKAKIQAIALNSIGNEVGLTFGTSGTGSSTAVEAMRIDSSGNVHAGGSTSITATVSGDNNAPTFIVEDSLATSIALLRSDTSIVSGNSFGSYAWYGTDTTSNLPRPLAAIQAIASGTHSAGDNPTDIRFLVTPDGTESLSEKMRIDSSGSVGIGTTNPSNPLEIEFADATAYSATASNPSFQIGNINSSANTNFSSISMFTDGNGRGIVNLNALNNAASSSADFSIQTRHIGTLGERLRVTSSGNVGIGESNPATWKFHVKTTDSNSMRLNNSTGSGNTIDFVDQTWQSQIQGNSGSLLFKTGGTTEAMRIDSAGSLLTGKTSADFGSTQGFEVRATGNTYITSPNVQALRLTRTGNDGDIAVFKKDTLTVGSIGVRYSNLYAGRGTSGLAFSSTGLDVHPFNPTTLADSDGAIDLGLSGARFKDLYLSGAVNLGDTYGLQWGTGNERITGVNTGNSLRFITNNAEKMRIDSSGNLLVGTTSSNYGVAGSQLGVGGNNYMTRSGANPLLLNRLSSDGAILSLMKDGTTVGSIGSTSGSMYIEGNPATSKVGLTFYGSSIEPRDAGSPADAAVDLGASNSRFKDLYLSGGVYLGGTGAANKLDDYEEGTHAATLNMSSGSVGYGNNVGTYVKVGNQVTYTAWISISSVSSPSGNLNITLPFAIPATTTRPASMFVANNMTSVTGNVGGWINPNTATLYLIAVNGGDMASLTGANLAVSTELYITITYNIYPYAYRTVGTYRRK
jgi:hypothetical protein